MSNTTVINGQTFVLASTTETTNTHYAISTITLPNSSLLYSTSYIPIYTQTLIRVPQSSPTGSTSPSPSSANTASSNPTVVAATPNTSVLTTLTTSVNSTTGVIGPASTTKSGPSSTHTSSPAGLKAGAAAGVAIGCLIGGALIAGLLTWVFMSNRHKKHRSSGGGFAGERQRSSRSNTEKALPAVSVAAAGNGAGIVVGNWEKHLDQPESDGTITRRVKGLFDHIEVHVENFYRDAQVNITPELQAALMKVDSHYLPDSVAGLLPQSQRPTMLIKHCIAQSIVEHISPESEIQDSFLPSDFVALPQALATRRTTANKPAYNQAYSRWRVLSSYLRPNPTEDAAYTNTRDTHITALADTLCRTFEPWAMSRDNFASRRDNLINIMRSSSETGSLLFSQPSTFKWRWNMPGSKSGRVSVVLLPGLDKTRDEGANELQRPLELLRPVAGVIIG